MKFEWKIIALVRELYLKSTTLANKTLGELFAMCPYEIGSSSVEAVLDSSRYFVLKIESDGK